MTANRTKKKGSKGAKEKPYLEIGRLIKDLRISKGLTQFDLADSVGVNNSYLSRIENGERRPSTKIMRKMSEVLDYPYDDLVVASGLLSPDFREKRMVGGEPNVLKDIKDIKAYLSQLVPSAGLAAPERPLRERTRRRAVPLYDRVPAGLFDEANVVEAYDDIEKIVLTEDELNYDPKAFALQVKGDSMIQAGILDGDTLIVSPATKVADGDIAVVQIGRKETTVKIVYFEGKSLLLQPANSQYKPVVLKYPEEVEILGRVILVRRKFIA